MRLRNVKYAKELLESYPEIVIFNPKKHSGNWQNAFNNDNPIELEIGCGKGKFIYEKAENNPETNYIGIEKFDSVLVRALEKAIITPLKNLKLIRFDAKDIGEIFSKGEVKRIYLNFSDPWPKKRQEKRRLTSQHFLKQYVEVLQIGGEVIQKTDNFDLFQYSMMSFNNSQNFSISKISVDMYRELPKDNVQTEFELKFIKSNKSIYYIMAKYRGETNEKIL